MAGHELFAGEQTLRSWPARLLGDATTRPTSGTLVLTDRRLLFVAKVGLFGRSPPRGNVRSVLLEELGGAAPHQSEMRIGYGDRMVLEGVEFAGVAYELGREPPGQLVLNEVAAARQRRRRELGLPDDIAPCRSCGRWIPSGTGLCASCLRSRKPSR